MRKLAILLCVLGVAAFANAATIRYKILINGVDLETVDTTNVAVGTEFTVGVQVNVPDVDFGSDMYGGALQVSFNLGDSANGLTPKQGVLGPPTFAPDGFWVSEAVVPMTNYNGAVDSNGYDVFGATATVPSSTYNANYATFGAGPGVWSTVVTGTFTWDGTATTLNLVPSDLTYQLLYGMTGAAYPTAAIGDSVAFVPEPATMGLLLVGGVAALIRRRK